VKHAARRRLQREVTKRSAVAAGEKRRLLLRFLLLSCRSEANQLRLGWRLLRQQGKARRSHCRRHCLLTGRGHSVYRHFRLTRNAVRLLAHRGQIYGLRKASW
jgi:ribosomal protein S14